MSELAPASGIGATSTNLANSRKTIADNFDTFLSILTTQLKNQNPLNPLDTNQFTQQMVQFTGVEQQLKTNEYLQTLIKANEGGLASQAVSYIGKSVTSFGNISELANGGSIEWTYGLTRDAPDSTLTVKDSNGAVVYTEDIQLSKGEHSYKWDGVNNDGNALPAGNYSLEIKAATSDGDAVESYIMSTGTVETVDFVGSEPILVVSGSKISLSNVAKVGLANS